MALYEELMEEGINRGSGLCCLFRADMTQEDFQEFSEEEQKRLHEELHERRRSRALGPPLSAAVR